MQYTIPWEMCFRLFCTCMNLRNFYREEIVMTRTNAPLYGVYHVIFYMSNLIDSDISQIGRLG